MSHRRAKKMRKELRELAGVTPEEFQEAYVDRRYMASRRSKHTGQNIPGSARAILQAAKNRIKKEK